MRRKTAILTIIILTLQCAIARAAPPSGSPEPVEGLTVSVVQHDAHADLTIGSFDAAPTTLQVALPAGWSGPSTSSGGAAPWTVVVSGTMLLTFALVRGVGAPQLGVVGVSGGGLQGHAYLAGPTLESPKPAALYRRWLPIMKR